mmetsp:Transcript_13788/g.21823  ORF Transcript_13788/g.21823 Transcript_13788/m.21823 type:complete len:91 (+) Transcript_13788:1157-1429(+)
MPIWIQGRSWIKGRLRIPGKSRITDMLGIVSKFWIRGMWTPESTHAAWKNGVDIPNPKLCIKLTADSLHQGQLLDDYLPQPVHLLSHHNT